MKISNAYAFDVVNAVPAQLQLTLKEPSSDDMVGQGNCIVIVAMRFGVRQRDGKHVHVVHGSEVCEEMLGQMYEH